MPRHSSKIKYETLRGQKSFKKEEKKKSFQLLFAVSFFYYYYYSVQFFMSFDQQAEERNKSPSSLCTHSCALSACGWKRDESVNRGRFRCSHSLSEANSVAVITVNLLCHSAAISSHSFISFPILFTAPCSYLIRQPSRFHKSPFSALQEAKVALWAEGSVMASIRLRVKSQQDLLSFCYVAWSEAWDYVGQTFESESFPFFFLLAAIFAQLLGSTCSNLLYQIVSPQRKKREQELQRTKKKAASTKNPSSCNGCFYKHLKGRVWRRTGCGSLSSAMLWPFWTSFNPCGLVCATDWATKRWSTNHTARV